MDDTHRGAPLAPLGISGDDWDQKLLGVGGVKKCFSEISHGWNCKYVNFSDFLEAFDNTH